MHDKESLRRTPLFAAHQESGASMTPFAGWEMPVRYRSGGDIKEHMAVRQGVGIFDVSHMGRIIIRGQDARQFVDYITTNDVGKLADRQAQYTLMCNPQGGIIDDLIVTRVCEDIRIVVNAGNRDKDLSWINENARRFSVEVDHVSDKTALIAVQGQRAVNVLSKMTGSPVPELHRFFIADMEIGGIDMTVSRTGYTGEDGFELWLSAEKAPEIWNGLLESGQEYGIMPCGLGARDTLRLEAGLSLYGHEIDDTTNPYEARLGWVTKIKKGDFIGREALLKIREQGISRRITGFKMTERGRNPRAGHVVWQDGRGVGRIVSGTYSPTLRIGICTGYVPLELSEKIGAEVDVSIGDGLYKTQIVDLPFYRRG